ncbi:MAG: VOC family protein [Ectothiorhodospiraceae bacterium]|nr:VOC family protein [Ectothiorhodospiraceae bacterium]
MFPVRSIRPHLWFHSQAREAVAFYCSVFPASAISYTQVIHDTPSGDCDVVAFTLAGQSFMAISAGPEFTFNPSISFIVNYDPAQDARAREHLDQAWTSLVDGGDVLMPLDEYPFSKRYGWVQDRYGLSWQLILSDPEGEPRPVITPTLMFTGGVYGQAEEAGAFYRSVFGGSRPGEIHRWPAGMEPDREGAVLFSDFRLGDTWFAAFDSARNHGFGFNEAVSFMVVCQDQAEIDHYWARLSAVPEAEACGWCKDRHGISWQIVPGVVDEVLRSGDQAALGRMLQAMMPMKKLDAAALRAAAG